jgi:uncharacterized membrane protein YgcG
MKSLSLLFFTVVFTSFYAFAQTGREVHGTVTDSTKLSLPGTSIKLVTDQGDSSQTVADANGRFVFQGVKSTKITLTFTSIGFFGLKKHFVLDNGTQPASVGIIILKAQSNMLNQVNIVGVNAVIIKEDTIEYKAAAFKVRDGAPVEDVLKKVPGVEVDLATGAVTAQGQQVTKVRLNGKDYFGGDVTSLTKNLPADIVDGIQIIDDYGDQANITGIKSGTPSKVLNITIRKDKNYGYFLQTTAGDGEDLLPAAPGISDNNRYIGLLNGFNFKGDRQISLLGSINNTNTNPFNFGGGGGGGGGGFGGGRGGGGGGGSATTGQNGITLARSIGTNYRDQWGKTLSVYGSYSFADNSTYTNTTSTQLNTSPTNPSVNNSNSRQTNDVINHRVTWNMEWKPDTVNYLKVTPTYSYSKTTTAEMDSVGLIKNNTTNKQYTVNVPSFSTSPSYGITALFNHRFKHRRNLSINATFNSSQSNSFSHPVYDYIIGTPSAPTNEQVNVASTTNSAGVTFSYLEPIGKISYLELNYGYNYSHTATNRQTDTLLNNTGNNFINDTTYSSNYNYSFITNKVSLSYREIGAKYNYTLGVGILPSELNGFEPLTGYTTHVSAVNFSPQARYVYNFSKSNALNITYNGSANQPTYTELLPKIDFTNALYPVQGNPNLKQSYTNTLSLRYNKFSFQTGDIFFSNLTFTQVDNSFASNTITYPGRFAKSVLAANPELRLLQNTLLTTYTNVSGYYSANGYVTYSKPFDNRKYTLTLNGRINYTNNVAYVSNVDSLNNEVRLKNIAKNLTFTPRILFRTDITDIIDAQIYTSYAINRTSNSVTNSITSAGSNVRTLEVGINGKNYFFKDWTLSYDFIHDTNYGYLVPVTNPNVLNTYVERRFLKNNAGTVRLSVFDVFNQNTGFSSTTNSTYITQSSVNRLGRYYLFTFAYRLQKFAGRPPASPDGGRGFRNGGGGFGGGRGAGGGPQ